MRMLNYEHPEWNQMKGGRATPYNPVTAMQKLESGENADDGWKELWDQLHHQGDIGEASNASVTQLVRIHKEKRHLDWNFYALVSLIEVERHRTTNPRLPVWLEASYKEAWTTILELRLDDLRRTTDELNVRVILGAVALAKGLRELGAFITTMDQSELEEYLEEYLDWSEHYC